MVAAIHESTPRPRVTICFPAITPTPAARLYGIWQTFADVSDWSAPMFRPRASCGRPGSTWRASRWSRRRRVGLCARPGPGGAPAGQRHRTLDPLDEAALLLAPCRRNASAAAPSGSDGASGPWRPDRCVAVTARSSAGAWRSAPIRAPSSRRSPVSRATGDGAVILRPRRPRDGPGYPHRARGDRSRRKLGVPPEQVTVELGDTRVVPQHLTAGSWGTASAIPAATRRPTPCSRP